MLYQQLFEKSGKGKTVQAGVIGTGHFATAIITQSQSMPQLVVPVVCDRNIEAAQRAYHLAGLNEDDYALCESRSAALAALEQGKRVILPDAMLMMDLPLDIVAESTGVPEASALHAAEAIKHGKHVAMVGKEVDVVIGPILKYRAEQAGLVYSAVDGDQHGLLIQLVRWARGLGLEVVCAGKSIDGEMVFDEAAGTVTHHGAVVQLEPDQYHIFAPGAPQQTRGFVQQRREILSEVGRIAGYDIVEMAIATNATGLVPDIPELHGPALRIPEIPEVLTVDADGGILSQRGVIDSVVCLRRPYEAGLGGGVFVVVAAENKYSRHILHTKGLIANSSGSAVLIYRPYHLCGVETPLTLMVAALLKLPTAATKLLPRYDVLARATKALKAGDVVGGDHSESMQALMRPAQAVEGSAPIPLHMANGNALLADLAAGETLTLDRVQVPPDSVLWALRAEQDRQFA